MLISLVSTTWVADLFNYLLGLFACELKYLQIYAIYPILYLFTMLNNVYMSIIVHPNKLFLIICVIICMQKTVIKLRHNNSPRIRGKQICQRVCVRERWDGGGGVSLVFHHPQVTGFTIGWSLFLSEACWGINNPMFHHTTFFKSALKTNRGWTAITRTAAPWPWTQVTLLPSIPSLYSCIN